MASPSTNWAGASTNSTDYAGATIKSTNFAGVSTNATNWEPEDLVPSTGVLLLETAFHLLLENSNFLALE